MPIGEWYPRIPKDLKTHLQWRLELRHACAKDARLRAAYLDACREDALFWLNSACVLHEPRSEVKVIPFITWPHQDIAIKQIVDSLGRYDIGVEKARSEGASYIAIYLAIHTWLFQQDATVGVCSSTEDKCDKPGDRGTLLGKADWLLKMLPEWMVGRQKANKQSPGDWLRRSSDHTFFNYRNNCLIVGSASTSNTGRGHRFSWFFLDEMAEWHANEAEGVLTSLQHATDSRLFVSTPQGPSGPYYDIMHYESNMVKVVLDWKDNPTRNQHLYKYKHGRAIPENPDDKTFPEDYRRPAVKIKKLWKRLESKGFTLEDTVRSPWYDHQCDRPNATPQKIAQELDRDYGGSVAQFFGKEFFAKAEATARAPFFRGDLSYNDETFEGSWQTVANGLLHLWCPLGADDRPPRSMYVAGIDVCAGFAGTYTSNSVIVIVDAIKMEQVAELAINSWKPTKFANFCIALSRWFWNAYMVFDRLGPPGIEFSHAVYDSGYSNVYRHTQKASANQKPADILGFKMQGQSSGGSKDRVFQLLRTAVSSGQLTLRSDPLVRECTQFIQEGGEITHKLEGDKKNPDAGKSHGDRVIAMAMAMEGVNKRPVIDDAHSVDEIPSNSLAARMKMYEADDRDASLDWDDRPNWDTGNTEAALGLP